MVVLAVLAVDPSGAREVLGLQLSAEESHPEGTRAGRLYSRMCENAGLRSLI